MSTCSSSGYIDGDAGLRLVVAYEQAGAGAVSLGLLTMQLNFNVAISICLHESACPIPAPQPQLQLQREYEHNIWKSALRAKGDTPAEWRAEGGEGMQLESVYV